MRKVSLLLSFALLAAISAWANNQQAPGLANGVYFIQNVETGKYINQGNMWNMHAVLADKGLRVSATMQADGSYTFYFLEGSQNDHLLYRADETDVFVDYNPEFGNACPYWNLVKTSEEGVFFIQSLITDDLYGQGSYPGTFLGNNPAKEAKDPDDNGLGVYNDVDGNVNNTAGMNVKWRFVPAPTIEIANPSFDDNNADGWEGDVPLFQTFDNAEFFMTTFDFHQTITGLKNGTYVVKVKGFHRPGDNQTVFTDYTTKGENWASALLYANGESCRLQNQAVFARDNQDWGGAEVSNGEASYFVPNCMMDAKTWFDNNCYENTLITTVNDGTITLGIRLDESVDEGWVIFDDFRLYYIPETPLADGIYLIQNVETGKYINQGNSWNMHAVLADEGLPVKATQQPDGSYTFYFLEGSQSDHLLFRDDATSVYVDHNSVVESQCPYWDLSSTGEEGVFHIQSQTTDYRYGQSIYPGTYLGNNPYKEAKDQDGNLLGLYNDVDGDVNNTVGMNVKWRLVPYDANIQFEDEAAKALCVANWDTNNDGELSLSEAASVTNLGKVFRGNQEITRLAELRYFAGLSEIAENAFMDCGNLSYVELPKTIKTIHKAAFKHSGLTWFDIPNSVEEIPDECFRECASLASVNFNRVKRIGNGAFFHSGITNVTLPETVKWVGSNAFEGCENLEGYVDLAWIEHLGDNAFNSCPRITKTSIPATIVLDENSWATFCWCTGLEEVEFFWGTTRIDNLTFIGCENLKSLPYGLPQTLESIGGDAFKGCKSLESITIPQSVTSIDAGAFNECDALTSVTVENPVPVELPNAETFSNRTKATLYVPYGSGEAYSNANYWKDFNRIVELSQVTDVDRIYADQVTVCPGATTAMEVKLANQNTFKAYQFELVLPEGITLAKKDDKFQYKLSNRYADTDKSLRIEDKGYGTYRFVCVSNGEINESDGTILTVMLQADKELEVGTTTGIISAVVLATPTDEEMKAADTTFDIKSVKVLKGDVNNSGEINIVDVTSTISHILGQTPAKFDKFAADVNNDGVVNIVDVTTIIDIILKQ